MLTVIASAGGLGFDAFDEPSKIASRAVAVENSLVTDNDKLDDVPLSPGEDVSDLLVSTVDASIGDEDAEDDLETVVLASLADEFKSLAISAVDTDRGEALAGNAGDISRDGALVLASAGSSVWGVSHGPLVGVGSNGSEAAADASRWCP